VDVVFRESAKLEELAAEARQALAWAEALDGREVVSSAALAARRNISLEVRGINVMGVPLPEIESKNMVRVDTQRGYSMASTSSRIDRAALRFEEELEMVIELAASEMRLRRLVEEIRKTTIRVNSLEVNLLPRLNAQCTYIENVLNEREREDLFRLKRIKEAIGQKRPE
jgi:V/A-type H+-transporting ATPase subunit D